MEAKYEYDDDVDGDGQPEESLLEMELEPQVKRSRPRVQKSWNTEDIVKLIGLIKVEPSIWNTGNEHYNNKLARHDAWSRVYTAFDGTYDESELHAKWSNLRIQFRNTSNKANKSRSVWKFANALNFLKQGGGANGLAICNSSIEDSNDSQATNISSACAFLKETPPPTGNKVKPAPANTSYSLRRSRPAAASPARTTMSAAPSSGQRDQLYDRDAALVKYLLSELRSLSEHEANILRCRLQRTLLEFNEERQNNLVTDDIEQIDIKYGRVDD